MLHESALREELRLLRACRVELRLCLCDVETCGDARAMALLGESERMGVGLHRIVENRILTVEAAQLHVVVDQLGEQRQTRILEVRRGRLSVGFARGDLVADLSPKVELIAHAAAQHVVIVVARRRRSNERRVRGLAGARDSRIQAEGGEETRARLIGERLGLRVVGERRCPGWDFRR